MTYHRVIKNKVVILVYLVKSYCVLKMSENKEEIRYILKFYYKKRRTRLRLLKKFVMFMDMMQYRYVWHKASSSFQSGNFDVKAASHSGRLITGKVDEIMEKVEQNRHISSHDISKELNIDHKTILNHLEKA